MTKKIFRSIFFTSLIVLICSLLVIVNSLYFYFENIHEYRLYNELMLSSRAVETAGIDYLKSLGPDKLRLTLVTPSGTVLYDTEVDASTMENHSDREEIKEALQTGDGESFRYSSTLTEKTIYRANLLSDGNVLRISISQDTLFSLIAGITPWILLVTFFAAFLSWPLAKHLSERIITPLNQVDLEHPLSNNTYEELTPLLWKIHRQHEQINEQLILLKQKTDEFEHITASMKEALILLDANGNILSINPAAVSLLGISGNTSWSEFLEVINNHKLKQLTELALKSGHATTREEWYGRSYQFDISRIENEIEVKGLVILAFDVTEQELAEKSRREFSANVSHELKTPLTSIIASAELIENEMVHPQDLQRFAGHILKEANRLLSLIEDIIRLSQLDEGTELIKENVDLYDVVHEAVLQLRDKADKNNIQINLYTDHYLIHGVSRLLYEITYNLIENAIKYNIPGGTINIFIIKNGKSCELRVSDTGIGIPKEHHERIFERFYRVDKSHSRQTGGTGLGLSIVKHAASYYNANIVLESEENKGTVVSVIFP